MGERKVRPLRKEELRVGLPILSCWGDDLYPAVITGLRHMDDYEPLVEVRVSPPGEEPFADNWWLSASEGTRYLAIEDGPPPKFAVGDTVRMTPERELSKTSDPHILTEFVVTRIRPEVYDGQHGYCGVNLLAPDGYVPENDLELVRRAGDVDLTESPAHPDDVGHILPQDDAERKAAPMYRGCIAYFAWALFQVSAHSMRSDRKHNPDRPESEAPRWTMDKSADHLDCVVRHCAEIVPGAEDELYQRTALAWRALAQLQEYGMRVMGAGRPAHVRRSDDV
jgi:hypothetical protein